jgi:hypothetical protein
MRQPNHFDCLAEGFHTQTVLNFSGKSQMPAVFLEDQ